MSSEKINVSNSVKKEAILWRRKSTNCQWVKEDAMRNRCAKSKTVKREKKRKIQKCFVYPKEENKVVDRRKCTPPLSIRALLCIKLMVKKNTLQQQTLCGVHLP